MKGGRLMAEECSVCSFVKMEKAKNRVICPKCGGEYVRSENENSDWKTVKQGRQNKKIDDIDHLGLA